MLFKGLKFEIRDSLTWIALLLLTLTQVPSAVNETLKLGCILTTWSDYAVFWTWKDIPLDERVRYCNGGNKNLQETNGQVESSL